MMIDNIMGSAPRMNALAADIATYGDGQHHGSADKAAHDGGQHRGSADMLLVGTTPGARRLRHQAFAVGLTKTICQALRLRSTWTVLVFILLLHDAVLNGGSVEDRPIRVYLYGRS